jgi:hypothetical protein
MKTTLLILVLFSSLFANDKAHKFASNEDCRACHIQIYDEFSSSMHMHSTPQKDPIHKAVWDKHPANKKMQHYACGKCHTPAADTLNDMLTNGKKALPELNNPTHQEGISCAYCHRIQNIENHAKHNTNIMSQTQHSYFGTREKHVDSPFHAIVTKGNEHIKNGNVCVGCHSHKQNKYKLNVCSTNIANEMDGANCVSCHMPKVDGTASILNETSQHTFHGFAGSHYNSEMLSKYVDISLLSKIKDFIINIDNRSSHALLLHPLRTAVLKVNILRDAKTIKLKNEIFVRVIGHDGKPAMPWKASVTLKDTMIKANEKRTIRYDFALQKGDTVNVILGWYLVNPKALKTLKLENEEIATKFIEFKNETFKF